MGWMMRGIVASPTTVGSHLRTVGLASIDFNGSESGRRDGAASTACFTNHTVLLIARPGTSTDANVCHVSVSIATCEGDGVASPLDAASACLADAPWYFETVSASTYATAIP
jgi:hypothetical protein